MIKFNRFSFCITLILAFATFIKAQTPLAQTPPMGYNSYNSYNNYLSQETAVQLMDVMAEKYLPLGYNYFVIDLGWYSEYELQPGTRIPVFGKETKEQLRFNIDKYGLPEPSKALFDKGIKHLVDYAHSKGLKFGLHLMRGVITQAIEQNCQVKGTNILIKDIVDTTSVCEWCWFTLGVNMKKPGSQEYYNSLIEKLANWGVDFIKYDDITGMPAEIIGISKAIEKTGRPIILSLSPGEDTKPDNLPYYKKANMLRVTADIWDYQRSIDHGFKAMKEYQGYGIPGFWPDLDMITLGPLEVLLGKRLDNMGKGFGTQNGFSRISRFTQDQARTFITQRAIFASPLMVGGDLITMDDFNFSLITNKDMIECNQNGVTGFLVYNTDSIEIYKAVNKNNPLLGWLAVFNRSEKYKSQVFNKNSFGFNFNRPMLDVLMPNYRLRDIWNKKSYTLQNTIELTIPAHGVVFVEYSEL